MAIIEGSRKQRQNNSTSSECGLTDAGVVSNSSVDLADDCNHQVVKQGGSTVSSENGVNNYSFVEDSILNTLEVIVDDAPEGDSEVGPIGLSRFLGYRQGVALMVGLTVGSGIFSSPGIVAEHACSNGMILIIWSVAGFLAMLGSLCYCELVGMFKANGSDYINILRIYGRLLGFLCAWVMCVVIDPCVTAILGLTCGLYLAKPFFPSDDAAASTSKILAAVFILVAATVNCFGVKCSSRVQRIFALAQILAVGFVTSVGIWKMSRGEFDNFRDMFNTGRISANETTFLNETISTNDAVYSSAVVDLGAAMAGALFAYEGWSYLGNAVEEMRNIERNFLLMTVTSFPIVILCYLLVNIALLTALDRRDMGMSKAVGVEFVRVALGTKASYGMMILVALTGYGSLNGFLYLCPRLTMAAARENHMPHFLSFIHKKTLSPVPATFLSTVIALLMLIPDASDLRKLIILFSQAMWLLRVATMFGVVVMRIRQPNIERPFKVCIVIPIMMTLISATLFILPFFETPYMSVALIAFIVAGVPIYFVFVYSALSVHKRFVDFISNKLQTHCGMVPCHTESGA